jgi:hypothetical protein
MYKFTTMIAAVVLLAACNSENSKPAEETKTDSTNMATTGTSDWVPLFDGKTMAGWHQYGGSTENVAWKVADGVVYVDTTIKGEGKDLVTDEEYDNFDLKLEWKIAKNGNSGIIFFVHEDTAKYGATYETGPEMQVLDNDGHPDGKIIKHRAGDLYDLISSSKETVKPVGEWNEAEIKSLNGKLDLYLNGTNVVSTTMWDDNWTKMIAGSKFKAWPGFGTFKKGHIALQDHGNMVSFRNIQIKKL